MGHGIDEPLPRRFLVDGETIAGRIKERPEDFLVEEIARYEPGGTGEHLYLGIEKRNVSHGELLGRLRRHFGVREIDIGFAGMKDKAAVTRQTVSVHLREEPATLDLEHDRIRVLWARRHTNKLRRGHLVGNRFSIRIRHVDPLRAPLVRRRLDTLARDGAPAYFGPQRFGYRRNNQRIGALVLADDWDGVAAELLGSRGSPFPEYQRERRELYDAGRYAEAAALWTSADRTERAVINALARGRDVRGACRAVGRTSLLFWISALQSAAFNRVLDARLDAGTLSALAEGDLAWVHGSRAVFAVTAEELGRPELADRLARLEISPSGPLWGAGMTEAGGAAAAVEAEALAATGAGLEQLRPYRKDCRGARRPLRTPVRDPELEAGVDEDGGYIRVAFDLPRGAYATVVLRELLRSDRLRAPDPDRADASVPPVGSDP
ncbi:MAG: tRNA pseudouridine(13) synthase TruD [Planctomycetota bacterium]